MPKKTDLLEKKQQIAEAAWNLILQQGMEGATVRNIAKEAEMSLGAVRYYFPTQTDLLEYACALIQAKIMETVNGIFQQEMPPQEKILEVLFALLPVEEDSGIETEVRIIFKMHAPYGGQSVQKEEDSVYAAAKSVISHLMLLNLLRRDVDLSIETDRLYALLEGLAMDSMGQWEQEKASKMKKIIVAHLNSICNKDFNGMV